VRALVEADGRTSGLDALAAVTADLAAGVRGARR
jgi:hypothetical protein